MYVFKLIPSSIIPNSVTLAHGGPEVDRPKDKATHTQPGRFIVGSIGGHVSQRWPMSAVPWGTPIRLNARKELEVQLRGGWVLLSTLPGWKERYPNNPAGATAAFTQAYNSLMLYERASVYGLPSQDKMPAPWNGQFPKTWVLNDFGRVAIKYFVDHNGNRKLDGKEYLLSDFIHTTPNEELETLISKKITPLGPMKLSESHGCIHMIPEVLQDWIARKVLVVGATIEVHPYSEASIPATFERKAGRVGTEIHFYPKAQGLALYRVTKKQVGLPLHARHG